MADSKIRLLLILAYTVCGVGAGIITDTPIVSVATVPAAVVMLVVWWRHRKAPPPPSLNPDEDIGASTSESIPNAENGWTTFRPLGPRVLSGEGVVMWSFFGSLLPVAGVLELLDRQWSNSSQMLASAVVAIVPIALLLPRSIRIAISVGAEGVRIRNFFRERQFAWSEVEEIRRGWLPMHYLGIPLPVIAFQLKGGETFSAQATSKFGGAWKPSQVSINIIEALRRASEPFGVRITVRPKDLT